jgi:hypothetical protein
MIMKVYHKKRKRFTIETQRTQRRVFLGRGKEDLPQRHRDTEIIDKRFLGRGEEGHSALKQIEVRFCTDL